MDLQKIIENSMAARRANDMKTSPQLTLGELVLKLETISNKNLPIVFDDGKYKPTSIDSWRGSYAELAIQYEGSGGFYEHKNDCPKDPEYDYYICECKSISTNLPEVPKVSDLIEVLKKCIGKIFTGYKGGDFLMGKTTPLWIANYGDSQGFKKEDGHDTQAVVDVLEIPEIVSIQTKCIQY